MSRTTITPGPWEVKPLFDDGQEGEIWMVTHSKSTDGTNSVVNTFSKPDADLISAAPDLRESLEWALTLIRSRSDRMGLTSQNEEAYRKALATLDKAKGNAESLNTGYGESCEGRR